MTTLYDQIERIANLHGNKAAIFCDNQAITYIGLMRMVGEQCDKMPHNLKALTMPVETNVESVVALLACARLGICVLPLAPGIPHAEQEILTEKVFGTRDESKPMPYLLLHTSGTTGDPKLIALSQQTKWLRAEQLIELYDITKDDVLLAGTPLHHSLAQRQVFTALLAGAAVRLLPKYSPELWMQAAEGCSFIMGLPQQLELLNACDTPYLRCVVSSSVLRSHDGRLAKRLFDIGIAYHECYGASEVAIATSAEIGLDTSADVGSAAPRVLVRIADDSEIQVRSPLAFDGYYMRQDLTDAAMTEDGWFKTGDVGYLHDYDKLHLLGRLNDVIKVGGTKVYPDDVEAVVNKLEGVLECAAIGVPDAKLGEVVHVVIVMYGTTKQPTVREVQHACFKYLEPAELPRSISFVESLPRTVTGKILRRNLR